jgi:hypothetical protein
MITHRTQLTRNGLLAGRNNPCYETMHIHFLTNS